MHLLYNGITKTTNLKPNKKTINEFLSDEYKDFALYVIESRAIPSYIDGFKPVHRKVIYTASQIWKTGSEKSTKVYQLSGLVSSSCQYHHGDSSLNSAIINMAQKFKNNLPLMLDEGQYGSLRSPQPGAARYIGTKLNSIFRHVYLDNNLLTHNIDEGDIIEPKFFLPIIPMVLVNGSSGIAVGFASNILNRDPIDIITACENITKGKKIKSVTPMIPNFNGTCVVDDVNYKKWNLMGGFKRVNTTTIQITELPPSMTFEKYELVLEKLVENKTIVSYIDKCSSDINYTIRFTRTSLEKITDDKIVKIFGLSESQTENFNTLDENGELRIFESDIEIITEFTKYRLGFYEMRKQAIIDKLVLENQILNNKLIFIKAIIEDKIDIKNKKKEVIVNLIESLKVDLIDGTYDYLLRMPLYSITKEYYDKIKQDISLKKQEIIDTKKLKIEDMYLSDLGNLKKEIKKIYK